MTTCRRTACDSTHAASAWSVLLAAVLGASGIGMGAFAAHALRSRLDPPLLGLIETSVRYQLFHAVALLALSSLNWIPQRTVARTGLLWVLGTVLFSGSLVVIALSGEHRVGLLTPVGGLMLLAGWVLLGVQAWRARHFCQPAARNTQAGQSPHP